MVVTVLSYDTFYERQLNKVESKIQNSEMVTLSGVKNVLDLSILRIKI